ncbi:flagellin [Alphaproteobacteria bacterium]|nr:flagellin [Alphaproteobacteria bacterium]
MVKSLSVHTNPGQLAALTQLNRTNNILQATQLRVTSGLKINNPQDDSSGFQISSRLRGDIAGTSAVKTALNLGSTTVNIAISGGKNIKDLTIEMKGKVIQANQAGLDSASRTALHNDFIALRDQINTIALTAEFNANNIIKSGATALAILSSQDGSTITVTVQELTSTALAINASNLTTSGSSAAARTAIDSAIVLVGNKLAALGASAKSLEVQTDFTSETIDNLKIALGSIVDADLAEESAKLQALQIQQALGVQALNIANAGPQSLLGLFGIR